MTWHMCLGMPEVRSIFVAVGGGRGINGAKRDDGRCRQMKNVGNYFVRLPTTTPVGYFSPIPCAGITRFDAVQLAEEYSRASCT